MSSNHLQTPLSDSRGKKDNAIVLANAPQKDQPGGRRPYFLKMLQHQIGTYILADTLDWEALTHFNFDATALSLDNLYKGLCRDKETFYFLWVAVRKVLEECPNVAKFSGARVGADQKTKFLDGLLDAALEQLLAELGDALMNLVEGPHCTIVDPRLDGNSRALRAKARSLVARFEKLGRSRDKLMVAIPATEAGIDAAARLQREDGINVNLTFVSGVMHAAACAQAGAVAVTLPIAKVREWDRTMGRDIAELQGKENAGIAGVEENAETIAAYFELHGFSSTTGLIASEIEHVDDACPLATMAALSFDAKHARKAEWYTEYPKARLSTLPKHDVVRRRAKAFPPPPSRPFHQNASRGGAGILTHLDAREFSAFAAITCGAIGSGRAAMSMITDIVLQEIRWQLHVMQPLCTGFPFPIDVGDNDKAAADSEHRGGLPMPGDRVSTRALPSESVASPPGAAAGVPAPHLDGQPEYDHMSAKKRKRSAAGEVAGAPDSPGPPPEKRAKRGAETQHRGPSHVNHRGRSDRRTRSAIDAGSQKPPTGPAAAFLYALGMQSAARNQTMLERTRGGGKWR